MKKLFIALLMLCLACGSKGTDPKPVNCWTCSGVMVYETEPDHVKQDTWSQVLCMTEVEIRRYEDRNYVSDVNGHFYRSVTCIKK